jgi:hypothetical protein
MVGDDLRVSSAFYFITVMFSVIYLPPPTILFRAHCLIPGTMI